MTKKQEKCQDCGEIIREDYLPSSFCEKCVNSYCEKVKTEASHAPIRPDFH